MPRNSLINVQVDLPATADLTASFRPDPRGTFWHIKETLKGLIAAEDPVTREHLAPVVNGFRGHAHQTMLGQRVYEQAVEDDNQVLVALGPIEIGARMNSARAKISDLLSLTKRREQARLTQAAAHVNDSGDE